jgi:SAM-dependent methyltransferase
MPASAAATRSADHDLHEVPESRLTVALYNPFLWLAERRGMGARRRRLLESARGRVLEIGAGTGLNLPHYPEDLEELVLAEPGAGMAARIDVSRLRGEVPVSIVAARAERLPFEDDHFDSIVSTLVLCTVEDAQLALTEIVRVLKPGGQLLFCEHVAAGSRWRRGCQRLVARPWAAFADGCRCDRPTLGTISARMQVASVQQDRWRGMPGWVTPLVWGVAVASERSTG